MSKVYVSSHDKVLAEKTAIRLRELGHTVVSTWHDEVSINGSKGPPPGDPWWYGRVIDNTLKINDADALLLIAGPDKYTGGKFVEYGIAAAFGKTLYILGGRFENGMVSTGKLIGDVSGVE